MSVLSWSSLCSWIFYSSRLMFSLLFLSCLSFVLTCFFYWLLLKRLNFANSQTSNLIHKKLGELIWNRRLKLNFMFGFNIAYYLLSCWNRCVFVPHNAVCDRDIYCMQKDIHLDAGENMIKKIIWWTLEFGKRENKYNPPWYLIYWRPGVLF